MSTPPMRPAFIVLRKATQGGTWEVVGEGDSREAANKLVRKLRRGERDVFKGRPVYKIQPA